MSTGIPEVLHVDVVHATPERQPVLEVELEAGATIRIAIEHSGILEQFPELDIDQIEVGIFGQPRKLDDPVANHDRVEIYRPLLADPKEVRRRLAAEGKTMGKRKT